ncbi:MAG TPA: hypothetical protein VF228_16315 [Iamia sp.]
MNATIEDEVRTMLARRAADVADDVATPPLPSGLRIVVDDRIPTPPGRTRVLALAAAVVLLLGAAGVLVATREAEGERADTTDEPPATAPARPAHLSLLPLGVDPTVGPVRGLGRPAPTPEEASDAFMADTFGGDVAPNAPFAGWDPGEPAAGFWAAYRPPLVDLDPVAWGTADANDVTGTVTARETDAGWYVVAVANEALDLRDVAFDGRRLTGEVRSTSSAPLRVIVSTTMGEQLAKSDLTTFASASGPEDRPSVLPLDDIDIDAGGQPVVLRVEAGDRPGQVGIDVRVAALATVILPAPVGADPGPAPSPSGPPETSAPVTTALATELPIDTPMVAAVEAALPEGVEVVRAERIDTSGSAGEVRLTAADGEAASYEITVYSPTRSAEGEPYDPFQLPWGHGWLTADEPTVRSFYAEGDDGPGVAVVHLDPGGAAASVFELIAIAEALIADPVVASVAAGGDPAG